jgi:hypothetical protein
MIRGDEVILGRTPFGFQNNGQSTPQMGLLQSQQLRVSEPKLLDVNQNPGDTRSVGKTQDMNEHESSSFNFQGTWKLDTLKRPHAESEMPMKK